jgi:hypothetical protein
MQRDPAFKLVDEMKQDVAAWLRGDEIDVAAKYRLAIESIGMPVFFAAIFLRFADATLSGWLLCLIPLWKDLNFAGWKEVLYRISSSAPAIYQFVPFAVEYLGIDMVRVIAEDPAVDNVAREFAAREFTEGGPPAGSDWVRERLEENGVDQKQLWSRFAEQGAPMK